MNTPSTGKPGQRKAESDATDGAPALDDSDQTRSSVNGESSPRLPHEKDESMDTGVAAPDDFMRTAKRDADGPKLPTDKSEETDATYATLRGRIPGSERDA